MNSPVVVAMKAMRNKVNTWIEERAIFANYYYKIQTLDILIVVDILWRVNIMSILKMLSPYFTIYSSSLGGN